VTTEFTDSKRIKIGCLIDTNDPTVPLGIEIWVDQQKVFDLDHVDTQVSFEHNIDDVLGDHVLRFIMKNKTQSHTRVDQDGNIIKDACLTISNITIDEFDLYQQILTTAAVYEHNFNGTGPMTTHQFYQTMGCNGVVRINFSIPVYDWLDTNYVKLFENIF
jgi:hypothetical protein